MPSVEEGFKLAMQQASHVLKCDFEVVEDPIKHTLKIMNKKVGCMTVLANDVLYQQRDDWSWLLQRLQHDMAVAVKAVPTPPKKAEPSPEEWADITKSYQQLLDESNDAPSKVNAIKALAAKGYLNKLPPKPYPTPVMRAGEAKRQEAHYRQLANQELVEQLAETLEENAKLRQTIHALLLQIEEQRHPTPTGLTNQQALEFAKRATAPESLPKQYIEVGDNVFEELAL